MHLPSLFSGYRTIDRGKACLLDKHAWLVLAGEPGQAVKLRRAQEPGVASLMLLAEQLASAYRPVTMQPNRRQLLLRLLLQTLPRPYGRFAAAVRGHGREAFLGAAIVGTAYSLGRVAWYLYRRRQEETPSASAA